MFVDRVPISSKAAMACGGTCSFRREKENYVPKAARRRRREAKAGSIIMRAVPGTTGLAEIVNVNLGRQTRAKRGHVELPRQTMRRTYRHVPPGTSCFDRDRGNCLRRFTETGRKGKPSPQAWSRRPAAGNKAFSARRKTEPPSRIPAGTPAREMDHARTPSDRRRGLVGCRTRGEVDVAQSVLSQAHPERFGLSVHDQASVYRHVTSAMLGRSCSRFGL